MLIRAWGDQVANWIADYIRSRLQNRIQKGSALAGLVATCSTLNWGRQTEELGYPYRQQGEPREVLTSSRPLIVADLGVKEIMFFTTCIKWGILVCHYHDAIPKKDKKEGSLFSLTVLEDHRPRQGSPYL